MPEAFYALAVLACPVGMGLMMWFMMRGGTQSAPRVPDERSAHGSASDADLAALRAEVDQLRAERRDGYHRGSVGTPPDGTSTEPR